VPHILELPRTLVYTGFSSSFNDLWVPLDRHPYDPISSPFFTGGTFSAFCFIPRPIIGVALSFLRREEPEFFLPTFRLALVALASRQTIPLFPTTVFYMVVISSFIKRASLYPKTYNARPNEFPAGQ